MMRYSDFEPALLLAIVDADDGSSYGQVDPFQAAKDAGLDVPEQWVGDAVQELENRGIFRNVLRSLDGLMIVTVSGAARREAERLRPQVTVAEDTRARQGTSSSILQIDRSSDLYKGASEAIARVADEVEASNSIELTPAERQRVVAELRAGERLLAADTVRPSALSEVAGVALRYVADKAAAGALASLARAALSALGSLLGLPI